MSKMKTGYALRRFKDAGTGETFAPGKIECSEDAYANYVAAGLVGDKPAEASTKAAAEGGQKAA